MGTVIVALVVAVALGAATGGSLDSLGRLPLREVRLTVLAVGLQVVGAVAGSLGVPGAYPTGLALSVVVVLAFLALNRTVAGIALVALGLVSNAVVVLANGAMPVSLTAAAGVGVPTGGLVEDGRHTELTSSSRLGLLADRIGVPLPLRPEVLSVGDVLVAAGLAQLVVVGMRRRETAAAVPD